MDIYPDEVAKFMAEPGDLLVCEGGESGRAAIWNGSSAIGIQNALHRIRPKAGISSRYLLYYFEWQVKSRMIDHLLSGVTITHFTQEKLRKMLVQYPPLEEQERIVEALDDHLSRIDKALADLQSASVKSSHLFLAALDGALDEVGQDRYKSLGACLRVLETKKFVQRGWSPQCLTYPQSTANNWAVLKTTAVQNMRYEPRHNKELPQTLDLKTHLEVRAGDFLMTTTGPRNRCGVVCYVEATPEKLIFSGKILRFRPDLHQLHPAWLELVLASHKYQKQLDSLKVGSSDSSVSIGNTQVLELSIPVPTLDEQNRLVSKIRQIKELSNRFELEIDQQMQRFQRLRKSLLSNAFAGNLESE
jgi:type I restriction enzyme S subunit